MLSHRFRAAEGTWSRQRAALTDTSASAAVRWQRWHATVGTSALWGAPLWRPSAELRRHLELWEAQHLRRILRLVRRPDESWIEFYRRRRALERRVRVRAGCRPLFRTYLLRLHQWAGHAARSSLPFLAGALRFRDTAEWRTRQLVASVDGAHRQTGWRHPARNWQRDVDTALSACLGPAWKDIASDRAALKASETVWTEWAASEYGALTDPSAPRPLPPAGPPARRRRIQ